MYEKIEVACKYCSGTGVGEYVSEYGPFGFSVKDEWRSVYEDCYKFALPQRNLYNGYYEGGVAGQNKMTNVFDSTAIHATQRFATS